MQALESENANAHLVGIEFFCACRDVPLETPVQEAAAACSAPVRQVLLLLPLVVLTGGLFDFNMELFIFLFFHLDAQVRPGIRR